LDRELSWQLPLFFGKISQIYLLRPIPPDPSRPLEMGPDQDCDEKKNEPDEENFCVGNMEKIGVITALM
jgi:hypothetical protein